MMAVDLHSPELLLPSQFLYDEEDIVPEFLKPSHLHKEYSTYRQPWEAPHHHGTESAFSSPVDSELGSAETESDKDDDYIAELTRQMAHYMLQDDDKSFLPCTEKMEKTWGSAGSPQSTLWGSNHGSPDGPSQEPSPPPTPVFGEDPFWDSTYDVVGKLEKMNYKDYERPKYQHDQGLRSTPFKPNIGFHSNQALTDDQLRAIQFYRLKQRVMKQQGSPNWGRQAKVTQQSEQREQPQQFQKKDGFCNGSVNGGRARTDPWTQTQTQPLVKCHQQTGSGMRMFFLGGESGSESCGTGVFLPRGIWYSSESRKKPGCSTVFIPARVVQALQPHFDKMGVRSRSNAGGCPPQYDASMGRRNGLNSKQKRQYQTAPAPMSHNDMGLPQEWKY